MPKMTRDGRVTIPKRMRDGLGHAAGCPVEIGLEPDGRVVLTFGGKRKKTGIDRVRGSMKGKFTTDELMRLTRGWP